MKKNFFRLACAGMLSAFLLCQCSIEELDHPVTGPDDPESLELFAEFPEMENPLTRIIVTEDQNGGAKAEWDADDRLNVVIFESGSRDPLYPEGYVFTTDASSCKSGHFTFSEKLNWDKMDPLDPAKSYDWYIMSDYSRFPAQDFDHPMAHLDGSVFLKGECKNILGNESPKVKMHHCTTLMKFTLQNKENKPITIESIAFQSTGNDIFGVFTPNYYPQNSWHEDLIEKRNEYSISILNSRPIPAGGSYDVYYSAPEFKLNNGDTFRVKVKSDAGFMTFEKTLTYNVTFKAGTLNTTVVVVSGSVPNDNYIEFMDQEFKKKLAEGYICSDWDNQGNHIERKIPGADVDKDGEISYQEALNITEICLKDNCMISSLEGIQFMPNLKRLGVTGYISTVDLSANKELTYLDIQDAELRELDLSQNTKLKTVFCNGNQLRSIDISTLAGLEHLGCDENQLESIDLTHNTELKSLMLASNRLKELNLLNNTKIEGIDVSDNELTELNLSNQTELSELIVGFNKLKSLSLKNNPKLTALYCEMNPMSALDVTGCPELVDLECDYTALKSIDLKGNPKLDYLDIEDTGISSLDLSNNLELAELFVRNSELQTLDISMLVKIRSLYATNNPSLSTLYVWKGFNPNNVHVELDAHTKIVEKNGNIDWGQTISFPDPEFKRCLLQFDKNSDLEISTKEAESVQRMSVSGEAIRSLEGIEYFTELESLVVEQTSVVVVDLSKNTNLYSAYFSNYGPVNPLKTVYVAKGFDKSRIQVTEPTQVVEKGEGSDDSAGFIDGNINHNEWK